MERPRRTVPDTDHGSDLGIRHTARMNAPKSRKHPGLRGLGHFGGLPVHASAAPSPRPSPPLRRGKGEFDRASAGGVHMQVKPRAGRDSGPSRGFPLVQPRVYPLLDPAHGGIPCAPGSVWRIPQSLRSMAIGQVRRGRSIWMTTCAPAGPVRVQVKPSGCLEGFPLLLRRVHPLPDGLSWPPPSALRTAGATSVPNSSMQRMICRCGMVAMLNCRRKRSCRKISC